MLQSTYTLDGECVILRMDRPEALNALDASLLDAIDAALDAVESDARRRAFIFCGTGRAFCAGADLKEQTDAIARVERMHRLVLRLQNFPKISVAAIDGLALGGGLELAMACTFRVAGPLAKMGLPEIRMNLMPGYGGTQLLPRLIGTAPALEMLLSGETIDAKRAVQLGLVSIMTDDSSAVMELAEQLAARCGQYGLEAQQAIRAAVADGLRLPLNEALAVERNHVARIAATDQARSGVEGFRQRPRS